MNRSMLDHLPFVSVESGRSRSRLAYVLMAARQIARQIAGGGTAAAHAPNVAMLHGACAAAVNVTAVAIVGVSNATVTNPQARPRHAGKQFQCRCINAIPLPLRFKPAKDCVLCRGSATIGK